MLKNIQKKLKSNPFILGIIGSVIGGILILTSVPLVRFFWKLLFSWSDRFSRLITDSTIKIAIMDVNIIGIITFLFVLNVFSWAMLSNLFPKYKFNIKEQIGEKISKLRYLVIIIYSILLLMIMSLFFINMTGEFLNGIQKLRMGIISPYINDQKEKELWSKWYLINSKVDYINLNYELDNIAENNNIELPTPYY